jgi:hypothetical protein
MSEWIKEEVEKKKKYKIRTWGNINIHLQTFLPFILHLRLPFSEAFVKLYTFNMVLTIYNSLLATISVYSIFVNQ